MTLPTKNPVPSGNILDQVFNAEKIDEVVNSSNLTYVDRFGNTRLTVAGIIENSQAWLNGVTGSTGSTGIGYRQGTVYEALNRTKTYSDYALSQPVDGYDESFFSSVFSDKSADNDLFLPGKMNIAGDLYGTSNFACLLTLLGNNNNSFRAQVVSGDTSTLSGYGMAEDLLIYGGIVGKKSVTSNNPIYGTNTLTITDNADLSKVKRGSIIKTSDNVWAKAVSISGKVITVTGWYQAKAVVVPTGTSVELNRIDKTYFGNLVMWIPEDYTGTKAVGYEYDFAIMSPTVTEKNGFDMVVHSASTYGMDTAMLIRSMKAGVGFACGLRAEGVSFAGVLVTSGTSGLTASLASFADTSANPTGLHFNGLNTSNSILWRYQGGSVYPSAINPYGFRTKGGKVSVSAVSGTAVSLSNCSYYVSNTSGFNIVLPSTNMIAGQEIEFLIFGVGALTVTCSNSSVNVNSVTSYAITPSKTFSRAVAKWDGSQWYFFS
ncbi:hypothetical protein [Klebsiella quasipneumoniae]|uniref:hypothetical protein n=1 Tax=Klebsiella quasipneumoniae TaxID=1463165 RepID=UPI0023B1F310|nr:hypothetical protein [Klebsiella quasipneumoniae]